MKILFLDDDLTRCKRFLSQHPTATIANTAHEAIHALTTGDWDVVFLDHDLGGEVLVDPAQENTGSAVVRFLVAEKRPIGQIIIHSFNVVAAGRMEEDLRAVGYKVVRRPFAF
jgi:DNA-binding response OmpR family regulator